MELMFKRISCDKESSVPGASKRLFIGSVEPSSGKSAALFGIAQALVQQGIDLAVGKPIGYRLEAGHPADDDLTMLQSFLGLETSHLYPPIAVLQNEQLLRRLQGLDSVDYGARLTEQYQAVPEDRLCLIEGPATFDEGKLFGLSLCDMANRLEASVLLAIRFESLEMVDRIMAASPRLGDRLLGVVINGVPEEDQALLSESVKPFLEGRGIPCFGILPYEQLLSSISVGELAHQLEAQVLCCPHRLNLMVSELCIGAMNVNSALKYFRKGSNMAVITGGARTDIQLAALEAATHCLILTGHFRPSEIMLKRAENLEVPVLSVNLDTLSTVDIIENSFRSVPFREPAKIKAIQSIFEREFDLSRLMNKLELHPVSSAAR
jgi:BioD-like phosphotransacetylase family protein